MCPSIADASPVAYSILFLVVFGIAAFAVATTMQWAKCSGCGRRFKAKPGSATQTRGSRAEPHMFDILKPASSMPVFCSDECEERFEGDREMTCGMCGKAFRRKDVPATSVEGFPICSLHCLAEWNQTTQEQRVRILSGERWRRSE
jgi:hypothetical protein